MQARLQSNGMMSRQERALPLMHEHSEQIAANRHRKSQNERNFRCTKRGATIYGA